MKDENPEPAADTSERPTPVKALRRHCLWCCNGSRNGVSLCPNKACPLWLFRFGRGPTPEIREAVADIELYPLETEQTGADVAGRSALKSIGANCIDCSGGSKVEARACMIKNCDLHPYRTGKSGHTRQLTNEQRAAAAERVRKLHAKQKMGPAQ